jgi:hypothetical protein
MPREILHFRLISGAAVYAGLLKIANLSFTNVWKSTKIEFHGLPHKDWSINPDKF